MLEAVRGPPEAFIYARKNGQGEQATKWPRTCRAPALCFLQTLPAFHAALCVGHWPRRQSKNRSSRPAFVAAGTAARRGGRARTGGDQRPAFGGSTGRRALGGGGRRRHFQSGAGVFPRGRTLKMAFHTDSPAFTGWPRFRGQPGSPPPYAYRSWTDSRRRKRLAAGTAHR